MIYIYKKQIFTYENLYKTNFETSEVKDLHKIK